MAVGVALSPLPIIAVILMLFTPRARINGLSFVAGWFVGLIVVGGVVLVVGGQAGAGPASTAAGVVRLTLGVLLLSMGIRDWRNRPKEGEETPMPRWMTAVDSFGPGKAAGLAALLSGLNPKNLLLTAAAAASVAELGLSTGQEVSWLVIYAVLASVTVAAPVVVFVSLGDRADSILGSWKSWLVQNNTVVMAVLLLIIGVKLIGDGTSILAS